MIDFPETWRGVPDWPQYEVSSIGRVRSLDRKITDRLDRTRMQYGRLKRTWVDDGGYRRVELAHEGARFGTGVHRLVAFAFHGKPEHRHEVRHLDSDSLNNCAGNLAWGTHSENVRDTIAAGCFRHNNTLKTQCPRGHDYSGIQANGNRKCATCRRDAQRAYKERRRERLAG